MLLYTRDRAALYLAERGVVIRGDGLKDHAARGTGPAYAIVNGRALYTAQALDAWISAQLERPVQRHKKQSAAA